LTFFVIPVIMKCGKRCKTLALAQSLCWKRRWEMLTPDKPRPTIIQYGRLMHMHTHL